MAMPAYRRVQKNNPANLTPTRFVPHGTSQDGTNTAGVFTQPGVRPQRFSAIPRPRSFLSSDIVSLRPSEYDNEILEIVTGQSAETVVNANGFCGNPPSPGNLLVCSQSFPWGNFYGKTELNALATLGSLRNRADMPGEILNASPEEFPLVPEGAWTLDDTRSALRYELYRFGIAAERALSRAAIQGVAGVQDNTFWGLQRQFSGLNAQISTGKVDSVSGLSCPAADSVVRAFNNNISATDETIVEALMYTFQSCQHRATQVGMGDAEYALVMRHDLFVHLVERWACEYWTYACDGTASAPNNRSGETIVNQRDQMLNGSFLWMYGVPVPVIFDEGVIRRTVASNTYSTDIFVVPYRWAGMPLIVLEYFDMNNGYLQEFAGFTPDGDVRTANNGLYLVGRRDTGLCKEYHFQARMRLILETPHLAGRLDNVIWTHNRSIRDAYPGFSFYAAGGASTR